MSCLQIHTRSLSRLRARPAALPALRSASAVCASTLLASPALAGEVAAIARAPAAAVTVTEMLRLLDFAGAARLRLLRHTDSVLPLPTGVMRHTILCFNAEAMHPGIEQAGRRRHVAVAAQAALAQAHTDRLHT